MPTIVSEILFHVTQAVLQLYSSISLVQNAQNALWGGGERRLRAREAAHSEKMPPDRVLCFEDSDTIGSVPRGDQILGTWLVLTKIHKRLASASEKLSQQTEDVGPAHSVLWWAAWEPDENSLLWDQQYWKPSCPCIFPSGRPVGELEMFLSQPDQNKDSSAPACRTARGRLKTCCPSLTARGNAAQSCNRLIWVHRYWGAWWSKKW